MTDNNVRLFVWVVWLRDALRYLIFRIKRAVAKQKAKREDSNVYPLW
jgi:hypothetical protein